MDVRFFGRQSRRDSHRICKEGFRAFNANVARVEQVYRYQFASLPFIVSELVSTLGILIALRSHHLL